MFQEQEYCRVCGNEFPTGQLSNRGLCQRCATCRVLNTIAQLQLRKGWIWEKWKRNYMAAMSGVLSRLSNE